MSDSLKELILCVDDVPDNLALLTEELEDEGYRVETAHNGVQALEKIEALKPSAVLLDWQMPRMSGLEVLVEARKTYDPLALPIIMVTALRSRDRVVECFERGANDYVEKPIEFPVLLARMRAHLRLRDVVSERQGLVEQLDLLSRTDALTGIANRRAFDEQGEASFSYATRHDEPLSLILFDADHFKSINDRFGHQGGDKALHAIAQTLDQCRRREDFLARIGGEEFAIICPKTRAQEAVNLAQRCCDEMRDVAILGLAPDRYVTLSAGVAELGGRHDSFASLAHDADIWMYRAKKAGRDRVCLAQSADTADTPLCA